MSTEDTPTLISSPCVGACSKCGKWSVVDGNKGEWFNNRLYLCSRCIKEADTPRPVFCPKCDNIMEPECMPDGCRDPDCPMLYGETIGMERLFKQIMEIAK